MAIQKPGYILHADHEWVQFHLANSIGGAVAYCRGPGAPIKNVVPGGKLFFRDRTITPKEIAFWADFDQSSTVSVDEAWERFGRELGAGSREGWNELVSRLPQIAGNSKFIVVRGIYAAAPDSPVKLADAGVRDVNGATKGWSIERDEVEKLLVVTGSPAAADLQSPPGRVDLFVSRIIRDTALVRQLKRLHNHECQICGQTITMADGSRYSEGHHLQPLGSDHRGPDVGENIICVCPNHHAACDLGAITLDISALQSVDGHTIDQRYIDYHNREVYRG